MSHERFVRNFKAWVILTPIALAVVAALSGYAVYSGVTRGRIIFLNDVVVAEQHPGLFQFKMAVYLGLTLILTAAVVFIVLGMLRRVLAGGPLVPSDSPEKARKYLQENSKYHLDDSDR